MQKFMNQWPRLSFLLVAFTLTPYSSLAAPAFVQVNAATPQTPQTFVTVPFSQTQTAGNLNVVVVGWNDTPSVSTVTDTKGHVYVRAVGPISFSNFSQSIYYATNISASAAGANSVTVNFSAAATFPDIRILEYSGVDNANPVDAVAAASGNGTLSDSGPLTTTNPTDLLVAANYVASTTIGPGTGFTSRIITTPDSDIVEDQLTSVTGSYNGTAPISSGIWVMQMVAFRGANSTPPGMYSLPSEGTTNWKPGVTYNGGFPARNTIYATLSPLGGTQDDTAQVQAALDGAGALATDEQHAQVVKLNPGTFRISGQGLSMRYSYVTLRGSGPGTTCWNNQVGNGTPTAGTPCTASDGTRLIKADRATNFNYAVLYVGGSDANLTQGDGVSVNGTAWNLALDANKDSYSVALTTNPGIAVGEFLLIDHLTWNATLSPGTNLDPQVFWLSGDPNNQHDMGNTVSTNGSRRWMVRQDRSINQIIEVTATALDSQGRQVLTFATPLHWNFKTAYAAQVVRYATPFKKWIGIEELYLFGGMNADWHGNSTMQQCAYCWYKHIESHWGAGGIELFGTYRSEVRDSYLHESWNETYGGDGYLLSLNYGASDNLVENNIMWKGNKVIVMRGTGGGNVAAYNYMEDAYGYNYPDQVEAGVNAGHYCTPHYELLEGNYAQNFQGDVRWGASAHITVFRNHLTMLRRGYGPLANYTFGADVYKDLWGRSAVRMERYMYWTNLVANVMGMSGQQLLSHPGLFTQTGWIYEIEAGAGSDPGTNVPVYWVGMVGSNAGLMPPDTQVLATTIRDANFDYVSNQVHWHGLGGKGVNNGLAPPANSAVPSSLYLQSKPAFFGSYTWPWVDPTGPTKTYTLPAKARFDAGTPNVVP